jgi:hypothetical protein
MQNNKHKQRPGWGSHRWNKDIPKREISIELLASPNKDLPYYRRLDEKVGHSLYRDATNRMQRTRILQ